MSNVGDEAIDVACTEGEDGYRARNFLDALGEVVQQLMFEQHLTTEYFTGDARNRLLTCRIDRQEEEFVALVEDTAKIVGEVAGAGVEVGLEDDDEVAVGIEATDRLDRGLEFGGVMGIVVDIDHFVGFDVDIKAAIDTGVGLDATADFFGCNAIEPGDGHGGYAVLDVDKDGDT